MALSFGAIKCRSELINRSGYDESAGMVFERECVLVEEEGYYNAVVLKAGIGLPSSLTEISGIGPKCFQENSGCPGRLFLRCFRRGEDGEAGGFPCGPSPTV